MADFEQINYSALHNQAYEQIKTAIRSGKFQPGDPLRTRALAKALGISSTPVREALSRLIAQNALDVDPRNRVAIVPTLTRDLLIEMYDMRVLLEGHACEIAAQVIRPKEIATIRNIANQLAQMEQDGKARQKSFMDLAEKFFFSIYRVAGRPILYSVIDSLWLRSSSILGLLHRPLPEQFSLTTHRATLVQALEDHDSARAKQTCQEALIITRDMVLKVLDDLEATEPPTPRRRSGRKAPSEAA